jgi:hypothetical protein
LLSLFPTERERERERQQKDVNTEGPDKKIMMISQELNVVHTMFRQKGGEKPGPVL